MQGVGPTHHDTQYNRREETVQATATVISLQQIALLLILLIVGFEGRTF